MRSFAVYDTLDFWKKGEMYIIGKYKQKEEITKKKKKKETFRLYNYYYDDVVFLLSMIILSFQIKPWCFK